MRGALAIAVILVLASTAAADPRAGELKQQGLEAAQQKNWELARSRFEASYALDPRPLTLYNLAAAQENTGKLVAARASYRKFLDTSSGGDGERFRTIARDKIANLDQAIPTLRLRIVEFGATAVFRLDDRVLARAELAAPIALDPGNHVIVASEGVRTARRELAVARGERAEIEIAPAPLPAPPVIAPRPAPPPPPPPAPRRSVLSSGWFWGVTAAVVVGAAAGGYYFAYGNPFEADPNPGTLGRGVIELP